MLLLIGGRALAAATRPITSPSTPCAHPLLAPALLASRFLPLCSCRSHGTSNHEPSRACLPSAHLAPACRPPAAARRRSYDTSNHEPFPAGDPSKRAFTYFVLTGGRFIGAAAVRLAVLKFLLSMTATKVGGRVLARGGSRRSVSWFVGRGARPWRGLAACLPAAAGRALARAAAAAGLA